MVYLIALAAGAAGLIAGGYLFQWAAGDGGRIALWWLVIAEMCPIFGVALTGVLATDESGGDPVTNRRRRVLLALIGGVAGAAMGLLAHGITASAAADAAGESSALMQQLGNVWALPDLTLTGMRGRLFDLAVPWTVGGGGLFGVFGTYHIIRDEQKEAVEESE